MSNPARESLHRPAARTTARNHPRTPAAGDDDLLRDCIAGNPEAWSWFVDHVSPVIWRVVWRFAANGNRQQSAEDIFQEVFVRLCMDDRRLLRRFDPARSSIEFYVALIARSTAIDILRKNQRMPHLLSLHEFDPYDSILSAPGNGQDPMIEDWQIDAAMAKLGEREREVIRMSYQDEASTLQIADKMGMAEATVRSTRRNALDKIRDFLRIS